MKTYTFLTRSHITHEVTIKAKSCEQAWDKLYDGEGKETEVDSDTYSEELQWVDDDYEASQ